MLPPEATATLARGEVVVWAEPEESVLTMTAAGTREEVVMVLPAELVVVMGTWMLVGAEVSKAEVVWTTTLPAELVDEITTGTSTPLSALPAEDAAALPADTVALEMAAGVLTSVLTTVLPAASVVVTAEVTGDGVLAATTEDATAEDTTVLPAALVVVMATVVPALVEPIDDDESCPLGATEEPAEAEAEVTREVAPAVLPPEATVLVSSKVSVDRGAVVPATVVAAVVSVVEPLLPTALVAGEV